MLAGETALTALDITTATGDNHPVLSSGYGVTELEMNPKVKDVQEPALGTPTACLGRQNNNIMTN